MAIKYYVNGQLVNIQSNATFLSTQDESLDSGSLILKWNEMPNALLPQTKFKIEDTDNNETWNFIIKKDDVEIVQKGSSQVYQHNLIVEQNTSAMTKKVMRDSIFSQPTQDKVLKIHSHGYILVEYNSELGYYKTDGLLHLPLKSYSPDTEAYYKNRIHITDREKISGAKIKIETCTQRFVNIAFAGVDRINLTRGSSSTQRSYQKHEYIQLALRVYATESSTTVIDEYTFDILNGEEYIELGNEAFMGEGWYSLEYKVEPAPIYFNLDQDDIRFTRGITDIQDDVFYPNVLGMVNISLQLETYYYSLYDVLKYLKRQQEKKFCYMLHEDTPFELPTGDAQHYLESIVAPEFKFNSSDLYSAIAEIFSYIDAVPTLDVNGKLGWEFLNELNGQVLSDDNTSKNDRKNSIEDTYFVDSIVTNYQNAKQNTKVEYPARNVYRRIESDTLGVPSAENYIFKVPHKIDYVDAVFVSQPNGFEVQFNVRVDIEGRATITELNFSYVYLPHDRINIIDAVFEESLYATLPIGSENSNDPNQTNSLFYARESNFINCGGQRDSYDSPNNKIIALNYAIKMCMKALFTAYGTWSQITTPSFNDLWKVVYNIEYHGIFDGRTKEENRENRCKDTGLFVAQASSSVDLNRMGTNMLGVISKLGNEESNVQFDMSAYGSRVRKGTQYEDANGIKWVITTVKTTFSTTSGKVFNECTLSKNYNSIGKFVSINQEKRFYEISEKLTSKGYENITEYIYFSLYGIGPLETSCIKILAIQTMLYKTLGVGSSSYSDVQYATIQTYNKDSAVSTNRDEVLLPIHCYGLGNSICFEMGYEHPLSAGNVLLGTSTTGDPLHNDVVLYAGDNGFADKMDITIYKNSRNYESYDFPKIPSGFNLAAQKMIEIPEMHYYKRPNEIFHLNYEISFMPYFKEVEDDFGVSHYESEEIFIGKAFIDFNGIISNTKSLGKLYLYTGDDEYSIRDTRCRGDIIYNATISITLNSNKTGWIEIRIPSAPQYDSESGKAWAIGTRDGQLVIGVNQVYLNTKLWTLFFAASGKKLY